MTYRQIIRGKANYREYAQWCGYDVVKQPELLAQRVGSVRDCVGRNEKK